MEVTDPCVEGGAVGERGARWGGYKRGGLVQSAGRPGLLGRVASGMLSLSDPVGGDADALLLALPGDLVGIESLEARPVQWQARALVTSRVEWLGLMRADQWRGVLLQALVVRHRSQAQLAGLRRGSVPERVRRLLLLLCEPRPMTRDDGLAAEKGKVLEGELPSLQDMAMLVDTAPETVSRVISALRRFGLLQSLPGRRVHLADDLGRRDWAMPDGMTRSRIQDGAATVIRVA